MRQRVKSKVKAPTYADLLCQPPMPTSYAKATEVKKLRQAGKAEGKTITPDLIFKSESYLLNFHVLCSWPGFGNSM
jgi:hypothetical protein